MWFILVMSYVQPAQSFTLDMVELILNLMNLLTYLYAHCWLMFQNSKWQCDLLSFFLLSGTWHFFGLGECWSKNCYNLLQLNYSFKHMFYYLFVYFMSRRSLFSSGMYEFKVYIKSIYYYHFMILLIKIDIIKSHLIY